MTKQVPTRWGGTVDEHEHIYINVLSDNGTPMEMCRICGSGNAEKLWAELNNKWNFYFDFGKWLKNFFRS